MRIIATLVSHRHLLATMVRRDIGARFAGSSLGGLWTLIHPVIMLSLYTMVFAYIYRVPQMEGGHSFAEFAFCGLWPWMAFQEACLRSVTVIIDNANLVKKLQFPSELLVISVTLAGFLTQGIGFLLFLLGLMIWHGSVSVVSIALLAVPLVIHITLAAGIGMILACGNVFFRDLGQLATAGFTIWFFLTPVLYSPSLVPTVLQPVLQWNPVAPLLGLYRSLILAHTFVGELGLLYCALVSGILFWLGAYLFHRCRGFFADYL
ncbi:MAG: ABC transporter permease [Deltaproteobacteria bacterium]|nr:ABC transporter permease [Deltaproteobacteria bacterium]